MLRLTLDTSLSSPLVEQIVSGMQMLVDRGVLGSGTRLPSIRVFAKEHSISTFTVVEAYERLVALGVLVSRPGAGFYVRAVPKGDRFAEHRPNIEQAYDHIWPLRSQLEPSENLVGVSSGRCPPDWEDSSLVRQSMKSVSSRAASIMARYGEPRGYKPLCQLLQRRLAERGIQADPHQLLLTSSAMQAYELLIKLFLKPGDCVLIDDPGYYNLFSLLKLHGIRSLPVTRTPDGPDMSVLMDLARKHHPKLMFTQSVAHNPTGTGYGARRAFEVLQAAEQMDFRIVEVDAYGEIYTEPKLRLTELDQLNRVIYVSTYSKVLSPAIRVGYLVGPRDVVTDLQTLKLIVSISSSPMAELVTYDALTSTQFRRHVDRYRDRLGKGIALTCQLADRNGFEVFGEPGGGKFVWLRLPGVEDSLDLARAATSFGVSLAPGQIFRPNLEPTPWFRINVAYADHPAVAAFLTACSGRLCHGN